MKTKSLRSTERRMALLPADTMWAIKRGVLDRIRAAAQQVLAGEFDLTGYEGALASRRGRGGFELAAGNVAVLRLEGILQRHLSIFAWLFGGTSTAEFEQDFLSSVNDPSVSGILLTVNSPGGSVDGTAELSHTIYQHRGRKPIIALADSMAASAALWIASSADKLFVRGPTAVTGSIGVIGTHFDFSERERASGLRVTEVVSTPKKNLLSPHQSLSDEGRAWMQRDVDFIHAEFIRALARNRGVSFERAASWGTGETFFAPEAIRLGIADAANAPDALIS